MLWTESVEDLQTLLNKDCQHLIRIRKKYQKNKIYGNYSEAAYGLKYKLEQNRQIRLVVID